MDVIASFAQRQVHLDRSGGVAHYGSPPGELAACLRNVGVVYRRTLSGMLVEGSATAIEMATQRLADLHIAVGGALHLGEAWWGRPHDERLVLVAPLASRARVLRLLEQHARHTIGLRVDPTSRLDVATFVGPRVHALMRAAKVYGPDADLRTTSPCVVVPVAGWPVTWMLQSDSTVTACFEGAAAPAVHAALEDAGRPFGLARVGSEAFDRFALLERRQRPTLH